MTRILVIGASGQLGHEILDLASEFPDISIVGTRSAELDITDEFAVNKFFTENQFDYLVNCAAYTAVDQAEYCPAEAWGLNVKAPLILAKNCLQHNTRLIHISTDYVFNGENYRPYKEEDEVCPISIYGKTKQQGEQAVLSSGCEAIIIRTSWLFSIYRHNFVNTMLKLGRQQDKLKVVVDQVGTPTSASDLALSILQIISKCESNQKVFIPGIFHYSNEGVCSWYDFALAIHEFSGIKCEITPAETKDFPLKAARPYYSVLNKSKIKNIFGLEIPHWRNSLKKCIDKI